MLPVDIAIRCQVHVARKQCRIMLSQITGFSGLGKVSNHSKNPPPRILLRTMRHGDLGPRATQDRYSTEAPSKISQTEVTYSLVPSSAP